MTDGHLASDRWSFMKRARNHTQKENRREAIMDAALELFAAENYYDISMNRVAKAAHLAKGTLYLYFETKEELFLAVYSDLFSRFFDELNEALDGMEQSSAAEMASFTAGFMVDRPLLMRLMTLSHSVLENNTKAEAVIEFKKMTLFNVARTGGNLERLLPFLNQGDGPAVVLVINGLILGAQQLTDPSPNVKAILAKHPELSPFQLETKSFLTHLILMHLEGMKSANKDS